MVKIKICGITNIEDYNNALSLGVDFTGFIFYDRSRRTIKPEQVRKIKRNNIYSHKRVGVFVNERIEIIREVYDLADLDIIQLHGDESPEYCQRLDLPYWKCIRIKNFDSINLIQEYSTEKILIDTYSENLYGGTGKSIDLLLVKKALETEKEIIVAGGISYSNVKDIINLKPYAIDINSSIEKLPGKKDFNKMSELIKIIRG
ncbi:MAG TPA: phosphoribosylanthranilate isomerase [Ignavibacteria bacterium]